MTSEFGPEQSVKEQPFKKAAENYFTQVLARWIMIGFVSFFTLILVPAGGWVAIRVVSTVDHISEVQATQQNTIISLNGKIDLITQNANTLSDRISETNRTFNSRMDNISRWNQKAADDLMELTKKFYSIPTR